MEKNFFASLFDFSFSSFIAPKIIGILYAIACVLTILGTLGVAFSGFTQGFTQGLITLIVGPIVGFIYILFIRIGLEALISSLKTAENTSIMAQYLKQIRDK